VRACLQNSKHVEPEEVREIRPNNATDGDKGTCKASGKNNLEFGEHRSKPNNTMLIVEKSKHTKESCRDLNMAQEEWNLSMEKWICTERAKDTSAYVVEVEDDPIAIHVSVHEVLGLVSELAQYEQLASRMAEVGSLNWRHLKDLLILRVFIYLHGQVEKKSPLP